MQVFAHAGWDLPSGCQNNTEDDREESQYVDVHNSAVEYGCDVPAVPELSERLHISGEPWLAGGMPASYAGQLNLGRGS